MVEVACNELRTESQDHVFFLFDDLCFVSLFLNMLFADSIFHLNVFEQTGLREGIPAHDRAVGTK